MSSLSKVLNSPRNETGQLHQVENKSGDLAFDFLGSLNAVKEFFFGRERTPSELAEDRAELRKLYYSHPEYKVQFKKPGQVKRDSLLRAIHNMTENAKGEIERAEQYSKRTRDLIELDNCKKAYSDMKVLQKDILANSAFWNPTQLANNWNKLKKLEGICDYTTNQLESFNQGSGL